MEEILIQTTNGSITTNFDVIKAQLEDYLKNYADYKVTTETLKIDKGVLADIRKVKKDINDRKIEVKKIYNEPITKLENSCKELFKLIDDVVEPIDSQIKEFEQKEIDQKRLDFFKLYSENIENYAGFIQFESVLEPKWENKSYTSKDLLYRLSELKTHIKSDLNVIASLGSEIENDLIDVYKRSGNNLSVAVQRNSQYLADKQRVKEQVKEEAREEVKSEVEKPTPIQEFNDLVGKINMVKFVVSQEDAQDVREYLDFKEIKYREE